MIVAYAHTHLSDMMVVMAAHFATHMTHSTAPITLHVNIADWHHDCYVVASPRFSTCMLLLGATAANKKKCAKF